MGTIRFADNEWAITADSDQWILYKPGYNKDGEEYKREIRYHARFETAIASLFDKMCREGDWQSIQELREHVSKVRAEIIRVVNLGGPPDVSDAESGKTLKL